MDSERNSFSCDCGQQTIIVKINGEWFYDKAKHGSSAKANGCYNCHKPFPKIEIVKPIEVLIETDKQPEKIEPAIKRGRPKKINQI